MTYAELKDALRSFGFTESDRPTMAQVKRRHRELIKSRHPDLNPACAAEEIRHINAASVILMDYLHSYRFCFSESEFYLQNPDELLRFQFADDPLWGGS